MRKLIVPTAAAGLAAAVFAVPALATHKPGHTPGGGGGGTGTLNVTLASAKQVVRFNPALSPPGGVTTLTGKANGQGNANQPVALEQNPFPFDDNKFEKTDRTTTTDAQGNYTFANVILPVNTQFRASVGTPASTSNVVQVNVRLRVSLGVGDKTPSAGQRVRFRGRVWPEHDGKVVAIQRRRSTGGWRTVKRVSTKDVAGQPYSRYSTRVRIGRSGTYRVRVRPADGDHVAGYSRRRTLTVG